MYDFSIATTQNTIPNSALKLPHLNFTLGLIPQEKATPLHSLGTGCSDGPALWLARAI